MPQRKIAFFGPQYGVGGAGRVCASVGKALARRGYDVDFLVDGTYSAGGYLEDGLPVHGRVVPLTDARYSDFKYAPPGFLGLCVALAKYLRTEERILVSSLTKFNVLAVWASVIPTFTEGLILIEHNLVSRSLTGRSRLLHYLVRTHYPFSDEVVAVSSDVREDLCENHGVGWSTCTTIRNPLDVEDLISKSTQRVEHDWFHDDIPVVLAVGRFVEPKQFSLLLEAFELLTRRREARLVLAGDGPLMDDLRALAAELRIDDRVDFLGFVSNPYKYMKRAELLAISSKYEGFGVVVTEALACGTPVVSTDCPGGPSDILNDGAYGELVDVGDARGLADAMARTLDDPPAPDRLVERARHYDVDKVADRYAEVIERAAI